MSTAGGCGRLTVAGDIEAQQVRMVAGKQPLLNPACH